MQINWSGYGLKDAPFFPDSQIIISANDQRLNGQLFCEEIVTDEIKKLMSLIGRQRNVVYVNSKTSVLGTGKSALMAFAYWRLTNAGKLTIWTETTGGLSTSSTLGRIIDSMAAEDIFEKMKKKIGVITYKRIEEMLKEFYRQPLPTLTQALTIILQTPLEETAKKFANIRRSVLIWSASEVFGYLLALMLACEIERPVIFLDQFEEFVRSHLGPAQIRRLANDFNDLLRAAQNRTTLVVSLHPDAEIVLKGAAGEYIQTIAPLNPETMVIIKPLTSSDAVKLTSFYLKQYRMEGYLNQALYPFSEEVIKYLCIKTNGTPRKFITALYNALVEGALQKYILIDKTFISNENNHEKILFGATNEWEKFVKGELR